jgi:RND family efflux transporter MFP subunit
MKTKIITAAIALIAISLYSCGDKEETKTAVVLDPVKVEVMNVASPNGLSTLNFNGKIAAANSATISTRMMGFVDQVNVKVGDKVKKGQLLMVINNADLQAKSAQVKAAIAAAEAGFGNAEKDYKRFQSLMKSNSISQKEMDDMSTRYEMMKSQLEGAKQQQSEVNAQLQYVNLKAPFDGVITNRFIEVGDMANPGMPLLGIEQPGKMEVTAMVPESDIQSVKQGAEAVVYINSIETELKGIITEVSSSSKNTGGQYAIRVMISDNNLKVRSGMYATVSITVENGATVNSALTIPQAAIVTRGQLSGVYTVSQQNTAILRWLKLGQIADGKVEVLSGLLAGEQLILSAESKLYNGAPLVY